MDACGDSFVAKKRFFGISSDSQGFVVRLLFELWNPMMPVKTGTFHIKLSELVNKCNEHKHK